MKFGKDFWITFGLAFLLTFALQGLFFGPAQKNKPEEQATTPIIVSLAKQNFNIGEHIILTIKPGTEKGPISLSLSCPAAPFEVYQDNVKKEVKTSLPCTEQESKPLTIPPEGLTVTYDKWHKELFSQTGSYEIRVPFNGTTYNAHFSIVGDGFFSHVWHQLFNKPLYNLLIGLTSLLGHSLGWAIILLTILIKLVLFLPTQHSMENQRKMQLIQPKLNEIQKKYKDNKQMQSMETMRILKENKVNPVGSCLPILIQIPVLIALFYAVQNVLSIPYSLNLYPFLSHIDITKIDPHFLGLIDLSQVNVWLVPPVVGILQFLQMKLALPKKKSEDSAKKKIIEQKADGSSSILDEAMPDMQQVGAMMTYMMPVMIAFMSISFPAGVGLYWAMQSILGIAQQEYVNKMKIKVS